MSELHICHACSRVSVYLAAKNEKDVNKILSRGFLIGISKKSWSPQYSMSSRIDTKRMFVYYSDCVDPPDAAPFADNRQQSLPHHGRSAEGEVH